MKKVLKQLHHDSIIFIESEQKYRTYVKKPDGSRKAIRGKTEAEIEKKLLEHYKEQIEALDRRHSILSIKTLWVEFMTFKEQTQTPNTIKEYIKALNRFYIDTDLYTLDLREITPNKLKVFYTHIISKYAMDYKAYNKCSVILNQLYKYCIDEGYLDKNPFDRVDVRKLPLRQPTRKQSCEKAYQKNESSKIFEIAMDDYARTHNPNSIAIMLAFLIGVRVSELISLKKADIIEYDGIPHIRIHRMEVEIQNHSKDFLSLTNMSTKISEGKTKGRYGERIVPLCDDALYLINILLNHYKEIGLNSEWLFVHDDGIKITSAGIEFRVNLFCKQAGMVKPKSIHKTRSTFISMLRDQGVSFEQIAEYVGHCSIATTMNNYSSDVNTPEENIKMLNQGLNYNLARSI